MIIPMRKYTLLVYHRDYNRILGELQNLGLVHIIRNVSNDVPELNAIHSETQKATEAIRKLKSLKIPPAEPKHDIDPETLIELLEKKTQEKEELNQSLIAYQKEVEQLQPWGNFDWGLLSQLKSVGLEAEFFSCIRTRFRETWKNEYALAMVNDTGSYAYFVVFHEPSETISIDAERVKLPNRSLREAEAIVTDLEGKIEAITAFYRESAASRLHVLETKRNTLLNRFSYEEAKLNSKKEADDRLIVLRGWVPVPREPDLVNYLDQTSAVYFAEDPGPKEKVPVLLKNNRFSRLFELIGQLYSLPEYHAMDLTAFFAPFYMLFFGVCTADSGYGVLMAIAAAIALFKIKNKAIRPVLWLVICLGISTALNGLVQGVFFAYESNATNIYRKLFHLEPEQSITMLLFNQALLLGVIQVLAGVLLRCYRSARDHGWVHGIDKIGRFIVILCLAIVGSPMVAQDPERFKASLGAVYRMPHYGIWVGLFLVFFFNSPGKNIFLNFAKGFWELYEILTGFFGDLLSYIRLFALGVSGGILGSVVNQMADQFGHMIPIVGPVIWLLVMVFGHLVNIGLGSLGGFVHPMRLTFVEFYKNAGFDGGGLPYKPFAKKVNS